MAQHIVIAQTESFVRQCFFDLCYPPEALLFILPVHIPCQLQHKMWQAAEVRAVALNQLRQPCQQPLTGDLNSEAFLQQRCLVLQQLLDQWGHFFFAAIHLLHPTAASVLVMTQHNEPKPVLLAATRHL